MQLSLQSAHIAYRKPWFFSPQCHIKQGMVVNNPIIQDVEERETKVPHYHGPQGFVGQPGYSRPCLNRKKERSEERKEKEMKERERGRGWKRKKKTKKNKSVSPFWMPCIHLSWSSKAQGGAELSRCFPFCGFWSFCALVDGVIWCNGFKNNDHPSLSPFSTLHCSFSPGLHPSYSRCNQLYLSKYWPGVNLAGSLY